jgi:hypothetical protein
VRELVKQAVPPVLERNGDRWTEEYLAAEPEVRAKRERWRHDEIRSRLADEAFHKCVYCEGEVEDVSFPNVDHILPKAVRPELAHKWENLAYCCAKCNNEKSDYYSEHIPIINPFEDCASEHIRFLGPFVDYVQGSIRGRVTRDVLDLNRHPLYNSRLSRIDAVRKLVDEWAQAPDGDLKDFFRRGIEVDAERGQFSAMVKSYLRFCGFPI